ncbi:beige/beach-related [Anaeramoeba flamelloides]|uniref:Beige/beach-related n=1 Tax=Anaeramoeba flamelloides TaxID=1746091 RepID=A0ABQ8YR72_9EUKA|nr:beige/beach-related [Anaeramoeba flamelloides]
MELLNNEDNEIFIGNIVQNIIQQTGWQNYFFNFLNNDILNQFDQKNIENIYQISIFDNNNQNNINDNVGGGSDNNTIMVEQINILLLNIFNLIIFKAFSKEKNIKEIEKSLIIINLYYNKFNICVLNRLILFNFLKSLESYIYQELNEKFDNNIRLFQNKKIALIENILKFSNLIINSIKFQKELIYPEKMELNKEKMELNKENLNLLKKHIKFNYQQKFNFIQIDKKKYWIDLYLFKKLILILKLIGFFNIDFFNNLKNKKKIKPLFFQIIYFLIMAVTVLNNNKIKMFYYELIINIINNYFQQNQNKINNDIFNEYEKKNILFYILYHLFDTLINQEDNYDNLKDSLENEVILISLLQLIFSENSLFFRKILKNKNNNLILDMENNLSKILSQDRNIFYGFITSDTWSNIINNYFEKTFKEIIKKNHQDIEKINNKENNALKSVINFFEKNVFFDNEYIQFLFLKFKKKKKMKIQKELDRIKKSNFINIKKEKNVAKIWRKIIRDLNCCNENVDENVNDNGDGDGDKNGQGDKINNNINNKKEGKIEKHGGNNNNNNWKLDKSEDYLRRRMKLQRNYNFSSHIEASIRRDLKSKEESKKVISEWYNKLSEKAKLSLKPIDISFNYDDDVNHLRGRKVLDMNEQEQEQKQKQILINNKTKHLRIEKIFFETDCQLITPLKVTNGTFKIKIDKIEFIPSNTDNGNNETNGDNKVNGIEDDKKWFLNNLIAIHKRRYLLRQSALELFFINKTNVFINFNKNQQNRIYWKIVSLKPKNLIKNNSTNPKDWIKKSGYTKMWQRREISNFEYLMKLNTIAGRTYNDLSQYPVFPWVISNYTSETIDLNDKNNFRDLSKPIGALNEKSKMESFKKYQMFADQSNKLNSENIPPFHYGSHYSSAGVVCYYLIRMEPFTTLAIKLQGGKFDRSDRIFHSVASTWKNCLANSGDVKELIPEFYYLPEFLQNDNKFDLGKKQNGETVDNIILPPWAKGSSEEFIRIMRLALESEYVSEHLNEWVDLIFGYKQRGEEAVKAFNVFYYLTYENSVDIDQIKDPIERKSVEDQIESFGQTPSQLFFKPHPKRFNLKECFNSAASVSQSMFSTFSLINNLSNTLNELNIFRSSGSIGSLGSLGSLRSFGSLFSSFSLYYISSPKNLLKIYPKIYQGSTCPIIWGSLFNDMKSQSLRFYLFDNERNWITGKYILPSNIEKSIEFINETLNSNQGGNGGNGGGYGSKMEEKKKLKIGVSFYQTISNFSNCFAYDNTLNLFYSCGYWDNSFKIWNSENYQLLYSIKLHKDIVTCLALDEYTNNQLFATGSKDTTIMIWCLSRLSFKLPLQILFTHTDEITCINLNSNFNIVVSSSKSNKILVHTITNGKFIRSIKHQSNCVISMLKIAHDGKILIYSDKIYLYSLNGKLIQIEDSIYPLTCWVITKDNRFLITGNLKGVVQIRWLYNLKIIKSFIFGNSISNISLSGNQQFILITFNNGEILIHRLMRFNF